MSRQLYGSLSSFIGFLPISLGFLGFLCACATAPDQTDWIRIGRTTKDQVIERLGQPDLVIASPEGDTVMYRPADSSQARPRVEVPTAQAGPFGSATTRMQPIDPGLGGRAIDTGTHGRPRKELRIRYDARGIVQDFSQ